MSKTGGVIRNEDTSPSETEAAEGRVEERQEELARLRTQIEERERALPLRERIKEIVKKYGVTVAAIFVAAGVTIGAVIAPLPTLWKPLGRRWGTVWKISAKKKKQPHFCLDCSDRLFLSSSKLLVRPLVFWQSTPGYWFWLLWPFW